MPTLDETHRHVDLAADGDPHEALIAVRKLLEDDVPWLERRAVQVARLEGWGWARIARLLLRSRQAVHKRFNSIGHDPLPGFESDDPWLALQADAAAWFVRVQARQAAQEAAERTASTRDDQGDAFNAS